MAPGLTALDVSITVGSLILVFAVAACGTFGQKKSNKNSDGFFLAGRNVPWWMCAASLFASNIGKYIWFPEVPRCAAWDCELSFSVN